MSTYPSRDILNIFKPNSWTEKQVRLKNKISVLFPDEKITREELADMVCLMIESCDPDDIKDPVDDFYDMQEYDEDLGVDDD